MSGMSTQLCRRLPEDFCLGQIELRLPSPVAPQPPLWSLRFRSHAAAYGHSGRTIQTSPMRTSAAARRERSPFFHRPPPLPPERQRLQVLEL